MGEERNTIEAYKSYVDPEENPERYYNHPLELNAVFMEAVQVLLEKVNQSISWINPEKNDSDHQSGVGVLWEWLNTGEGSQFSRFRDLFWLGVSRGVKKISLFRES